IDPMKEDHERMLSSSDSLSDLRVFAKAVLKLERHFVLPARAEIGELAIQERRPRNPGHPEKQVVVHGAMIGGVERTDAIEQAAAKENGRLADVVLHQ